MAKITDKQQLGCVYVYFSGFKIFLQRMKHTN